MIRKVLVAVSLLLFIVTLDIYGLTMTAPLRCGYITVRNRRDYEINWNTPDMITGPRVTLGADRFRYFSPRFNQPMTACRTYPWKVKLRGGYQIT